MPAFAPARPGSTAAWWAVLPPRDTLLVAGRDAVRFIDGFQTAAVGRLAVGTGTEAFFTDGRGWVIALANILRLDDVSGSDGSGCEASGREEASRSDFGKDDSAAVDDGASLWIDLPAGLAGPLVAHLEHYHIREDVEFRDVSADRAGLLIGGPGAAAWLAAGASPRLSVALPGPRLDHCRGRLGDIPVRIVRSDWFDGDGVHVFSTAADQPRLRSWLVEAGLPQADQSALEEARILAANPEPVDIPEKTLPQELGRVDRAVCFTKGCYLGQETVARLDALGHVNRRLVALALAAVPRHLPAAVMQLPGDTPAGAVTSACHSHRLGGGLGLALVQVKALATTAGAGPVLSVDGAAARVVGSPTGGAP